MRGKTLRLTEGSLCLLIVRRLLHFFRLGFGSLLELELDGLRYSPAQRESVGEIEGC